MDLNEEWCDGQCGLYCQHLVIECHSKPVLSTYYTSWQCQKNCQGDFTLTRHLQSFENGDYTHVTLECNECNHKHSTPVTNKKCILCEEVTTFAKEGLNFRCLCCGAV